MKRIFMGFLCSTALFCFADVNFVTVKMYQTEEKGHGDFLGTVQLIDTDQGLLIQPNLSNLGQGEHGFHVHVNPSCENNGEAAGGHLDPLKTNAHLGPLNNGHLGDLPVLVVDKDGMATQAVTAPHLKLKDVEGHTLMIHQFGDNYSDTPEKNGGGGPREACGLIPTNPQ